MAIRRAAQRLLALCGIPLFLGTAMAQEVSDFAVQVSAQVQTDPPQIRLSWPPVEGVSGYAVSRKSKAEVDWGAPTVLPGTATEFTDTDVMAGGSYEYYLKRSTPNYDGHGYIFAGIQAPLQEFRGKVLLLADDTLSSSLGTELARLEQDLVGDGWEVLRHDLPRTAVSPTNPAPAAGALRLNELVTLKRVIQRDYIADPAHVRAVLLFGHLPVPYSGVIAPDGHADHLGAWPADAYYGDMDGTWSDLSATQTSASDPRNRNVPGDGKFDQNSIPATLALEVGRVDMANLPVFPQSELDLLRQYLDKDHQFRHKLFTAKARGLINDNLGLLIGGVPAVNGWENFAPLFGASNTVAGRWLSDLTKSDYLWAYGCGAGTYSQAAGVVDTTHFLVYQPKVVFTMLFGSYFGDWDSDNNLLRAQLANQTYTLASAWVGRPNWFFHHMGLGETIGFSTRLSQNNLGLYRGNNGFNGIQIGGTDDSGNDMHKVHLALMGDPTLRLQPLAPASNFTAVLNSSGSADLSWTASADSVLGYGVYRAPFPGGPYTRINDQLVLATQFTDPIMSSEPFYMVRAVRLEASGSGTYYNLSQGVFSRLEFTPTSPDDRTWAGRGSRTWTINDALGTAGTHPGWDQVEIDGFLNITATAANRFTVRIVSLQSDDTPGTPAHFNNNLSYRWPILTTSSPITGFFTNKIDLRTSEFQGDLGGGTFSLALSPDGTSIQLVFTPNHPPITLPAIYVRARDAGLRIDLQEFLTKFTSDTDADRRALLQVGPSTNGTAIATDGRFIFFAPTNNLTEIIAYTVQDSRAYRAGDNVRVATGTIRLEPVPADAVASQEYSAIEVEWPSEEGKLYRLQSRPSVDSEWTDQGDLITGTGKKMSLFERARGAAKLFRVIPVE